MNPKYEISEYESLRDFLNANLFSPIYCMKYKDRYVLFSGQIAFDYTILDVYFLDSRPKDYIGLKKGKAVFSNESKSDLIPISFVKSSSLTKKILDSYLEGNK